MLAHGAASRYNFLKEEYKRALECFENDEEAHNRALSGVNQALNEAKKLKKLVQREMEKFRKVAEHFSNMDTSMKEVEVVVDSSEKEVKSD